MKTQGSSENTSKVTEYRPISLYNLLNKLIAKVLVNRFKKALSYIISQNQSVFIHGRLISNNILVAYKTLHTMNARMKVKAGYMVLKLNMSKVNDRV